MANAKRDGAAPEEVRDLRRSIEWMKKEGDIIVTDKEVDPNLEITGIQKRLDGGCPILFNNVKGKPQHRCITNLFGDMPEPFFELVRSGFRQATTRSMSVSMLIPVFSSNSC